MFADDGGKELMRFALGLGINHNVVVSHLFEKTVSNQTVDTSQKNSLGGRLLGHLPVLRRHH